VAQKLISTGRPRNWLKRTVSPLSVVKAKSGAFPSPLLDGDATPPMALRESIT